MKYEEVSNKNVCIYNQNKLKQIKKIKFYFSRISNSTITKEKKLNNYCLNFQNIKNLKKKLQLKSLRINYELWYGLIRPQTSYQREQN